MPYPLEAALSGVRALPWSSALPTGGRYIHSNINNGSTPCSFWYASIAFRSSIERYTNTPGRSLPSIGGTKAELPVAIVHVEHV